MLAQGQSTGRGAPEAQIDPKDVHSTLVDDICYIAHRSASRAINSADVFSISAVLNNVVNILSAEVRSAIEVKFSHSRKAYVAMVEEACRTGVLNFVGMISRQRATFLKATTSAVAAESATCFGCQYSWAHTLNNVERFVVNCKMLSSSIEREFDDMFGSLEVDEDSVKSDAPRLVFLHSLQGVDLIRTEFQHLLDQFGAETGEILLMYLRQTLATLTDFSLGISSAEFAEYQVNDPFIKQLITKLHHLVEHTHTVYTDRAAKSIWNHIIDKVVATCEKMILTQYTVSAMGAMLVDGNIRELLNALMDQTPNYPIRHKFGRLTEIGEILTVISREEFEDLTAHTSYGKTSKLTEEEVKLLFSLRKDLANGD